MFCFYFLSFYSCHFIASNFYAPWALLQLEELQPVIVAMVSQVSTASSGDNPQHLLDMEDNGGSEDDGDESDSGDLGAIKRKLMPMLNAGGWCFLGRQLTRMITYLFACLTGITTM